MQLHPVEPGTGEIGCKKNLRAKLATYFAQLPVVRIAIEVQQRAAMCAGAERPGREVELLPAAQVRQFVRGKDNAAMRGSHGSRHNKATSDACHNKASSGRRQWRCAFCVQQYILRSDPVQRRWNTPHFHRAAVCDRLLLAVMDSYA